MRKEPTFYPWAFLVIALGIAISIFDNLYVGFVFIGTGIVASLFVYWWEHFGN